MEYSYFLEALRWNVSNKWKRQQGVLATEANISNAFLSEIINERKRAGFETQVAISKACKYEYEDFLSLGRSIAKKETKDIPGKDSGINQTETLDAKVGNGMVRNDDEILQHYREELAALREEIKYLRSESKELRDELKQSREQTKPIAEKPTEKKTAI